MGMPLREIISRSVGVVRPTSATRQSKWKRQEGRRLNCESDPEEYRRLTEATSRATPRALHTYMGQTSHGTGLHCRVALARKSVSTTENPVSTLSTIPIRIVARSRHRATPIPPWRLPRSRRLPRVVDYQCYP